MWLVFLPLRFIELLGSLIQIMVESIWELFYQSGNLSVNLSWKPLCATCVKWVCFEDVMVFDLFCGDGGISRACRIWTKGT